jgi:hypothetical protein
MRNGSQSVWSQSKHQARNTSKSITNNQQEESKKLSKNKFAFKRGISKKVSHPNPINPNPATKKSKRSKEPSS